MNLAKSNLDLLKFLCEMAASWECVALRKLANSFGMARNMVLQRVAFSAVVKLWFGSSVWKATDGNGDMEHVVDIVETCGRLKCGSRSHCCECFGCSCLNAERMAIMLASGWAHAHAPILRLYKSSGCFSQLI